MKMKIVFIIIIFFSTNEQLLCRYVSFFRPNDSRGVALGLTGASYQEGVLAYDSNPAGLAFIKASQFAYSHYPSESYRRYRFNQDYIAIAIPVGNNTALGFSNSHLYLGDGSGINDIIFSLSKLFQTNKHFISVGINMNYQFNYSDSNSEGSLFFDAGFRYKILNDNYLQAIGLSISNFNHEYQNYLLKSGFAIGINNIGKKNIDLLGIVEYQGYINGNSFDNWNSIGTGIELQFHDYLSMRIGYNIDLDYHEYQGVTYGFSFRSPDKIDIFKPFHLTLSYGQGINDYLKMNVISILLEF